MFRSGASVISDDDRAEIKDISFITVQFAPSRKLYHSQQREHGWRRIPKISKDMTHGST